MTTGLTTAVLEAFGAEGAWPKLLRRYHLDAPHHSRNLALERRRQFVAKLILRQRLAELVDAFGLRIPVIVLKGEPLEKRLFDGAYLRSTGDIDVLVHPRDVGKAQRRLHSLGYRPVRREAPRRWAHNQQPWVRPGRPVVVELHWACALPGVPSLPIDELFATRRCFRVTDDLEVDVLHPRWLIAYLALHFHHHLGFAKGLVDIAGWCDRYGDDVDRQAILDTLGRLKLFGVLQWPLHTLAELISHRPPLYCEDVDAATKLWAMASARAMRNCLRRRPRGDVETTLVGTTPDVGLVGALSIQALSMLTVDGWPAKVGGALRRSLMGPHRVGRWLDRALRMARKTPKKRPATMYKQDPHVSSRRGAGR